MYIQEQESKFPLFTLKSSYTQHNPLFFFSNHFIAFLQTSLACSFTVTFMAYSGVLHPPAGAISIIVIQFGNKTNELSNIGLLYLVVSVLYGLVVFIVVALIIDNISPKRSYPAFW